MDNRPDNPDRQLEEKLRKEIPYIIQQAVKGVQEVFEENALYESERSRELVAELYGDCDSVQGFIQKMLVKDMNEQVRTTELFESYKKYCQSTERESLSRNNFYRNLRNKGYGKKVVHGNEYFTGLKFKEQSDFIAINPREEVPF